MSDITKYNSSNQNCFIPNENQVHLSIDLSQSIQLGLILIVLLKLLS